VVVAAGLAVVVVVAVAVVQDFLVVRYFVFDQ